MYGICCSFCGPGRCIETNDETSPINRSFLGFSLDRDKNRVSLEMKKALWPMGQIGSDRVQLPQHYRNTLLGTSAER